MNYDLVFISYQEENAEENWAHLIKRFPNAQRVHGITGIREAHEQAAHLSNHDYFFTLDGDNQLIDDFELKLPTEIKPDTIYVWRCLNNVNGLIYGYGGLKLWSKDSFSQKLSSYNDHAMSATKNYCVVNDLASETYFATSELTSWRSAFREATKLVRNIITSKDTYSKARLDTWLNIGNHHQYGQHVIKGARQGCLFAHENDEQSISKAINNFETLTQLHSTLSSQDSEELTKRLRQKGYELQELDHQESLRLYHENISNWHKKNKSGF